MRSLRVFCFLWDDPLFTDSNWTAEWGPHDELSDPECFARRREIRLLALDMLYMDIARLKKELTGMREIAGRAVWTWQRLIVHASADVRKHILIESQINAMDPDFSFCKAIGME